MQRADEQQAIIDAAIKDALGIPTLFYDPDTTGAFPISKKHNLGISANASVSLGSGTLDGNMSIIYCEFVNHNASSGTNVTVTFRNRTQSGISNVSANISGTRVTVFVTRLQDGFPMSSGDSISVTGVSEPRPLPATFTFLPSNIGRLMWRGTAEAVLPQNKRR